MFELDGLLKKHFSSLSELKGIADGLSLDWIKKRVWFKKHILPTNKTAIDFVTIADRNLMACKTEQDPIVKAKILCEAILGSLCANRIKGFEDKRFDDALERAKAAYINHCRTFVDIGMKNFPPQNPNHLRNAIQVLKEVGHGNLEGYEKTIAAYQKLTTASENLKDFMLRIHSTSDYGRCITLAEEYDLEREQTARYSKLTNTRIRIHVKLHQTLLRRIKAINLMLDSEKHRAHPRADELNRLEACRGALENIRTLVFRDGADPKNIQPGETIDGQYEVLDRIGEGGFAVAYKVREIATSRIYALKVFADLKDDDYQTKQDIIKEAAEMESITDQRVVRYYHTSLDTPVKYMKMEFIDGGTLEKRLSERGGKFPEQQVLEYAREIALAMEVVHNKDIIHKDLTPRNIGFTSGGEIKIMDFGLSEALQTSHSRILQTSRSGTAPYMSPEQIIGKNVGRETDIWAFGVILYQMLTGKTCFAGGNSLEVMTSINGILDIERDREHDKINQYGAIEQPEGVSDETYKLIRGCLTYDYKERIRSFGEVVEEIEGILNPGSPLNPPLERGETGSPVKPQLAEEESESGGIDGLSGNVSPKEPVAGKKASESYTFRDAESTGGSPGATASREKTGSPHNPPLERGESGLATESPSRSAEETKGGKSHRTWLWIPFTVAALLIAYFGFIEPKYGSIENMWAKYFNPNFDEIKRIDGPLPGMTFVKIPAGSFEMGSPRGFLGIGREKGRQDDEGPVHTVRLSSFYMMTTEVTNAMWKEVIGNNPSHFKGDNNPVEQVSWNDCQEFLKKLNERDPGKNYRLPTEAEWEYACRAGTKTRFYSGNSDSDLDRVAWYGGNSNSKTHPVGQKQPNAWGLYDMHGNVWEWCEDWYGDYPSGSVTDPKGPSSGSYRVLRGGSWVNYPDYCRCAYRSYYIPSATNYNYGFRVVGF